MKFNPHNRLEAQAKAAEIKSIVVSVVSFYQTENNKAGIVPAGARWRELRFSFRRHAEMAMWPIKADELWDFLYRLVVAGVIREVNTIHMPRYIIDYEELRRYETRWNFPKNT